MPRSDERAPDQIRPIHFELNVAPYASGSVLVSMGNTRVICGVTIEEAVPRWMKLQNVSGGWLSAEYSMLPYSTQTRKPRDITKGRLDGRSTEIQRLIGRSPCGRLVDCWNCRRLNTMPREMASDLAALQISATSR